MRTLLAFGARLVQIRPRLTLVCLLVATIVLGGLASQQSTDTDLTAFAPDSELARKAPKPCSTCGYFVPMAGALRSVFGVCANEWSPADGSVVALSFGCGAHSEIDVDKAPAEQMEPPVLDDDNDVIYVER